MIKEGEPHCHVHYLRIKSKSTLDIENFSAGRFYLPGYFLCKPGKYRISAEYTYIDKEGVYKKAIAYSNEFTIKEISRASLLQLNIKSASEVFILEEKITIELLIKNLSPKEIRAPSLIWSSKVIIDDKEYNRRPKHIDVWHGPVVILPGTKKLALESLSLYDIPDNILEAGKHNIAMKIGSVVSNTITIEIVEQKQPQPTIKSKKPKVTLDVSRSINSEIDKRMIDIAENVYPRRSEVVEAIKEAHFKLKEIPTEEKLWWYSEFNGRRIPYSITSEAITYYANLIEKYRDEEWETDIEPRSDFSYSALVELKDSYEKDGKVFKNVYVVDLKLRFSEYRASLSGLFFGKERTVVLTHKGAVLAIFGDGKTEVGVK